MSEKQREYQAAERDVMTLQNKLATAEEQVRTATQALQRLEAQHRDVNEATRRRLEDEDQRRKSELERSRHEQSVRDERLEKEHKTELDRALLTYRNELEREKKSARDQLERTISDHRHELARQQTVATAANDRAHVMEQKAVSLSSELERERTAQMRLSHEKDSKEGSLNATNRELIAMKREVSSLMERNKLIQKQYREFKRRVGVEVAGKIRGLAELARNIQLQATNELNQAQQGVHQLVTRLQWQYTKRLADDARVHERTLSQRLDALRMELTADHDAARDLWLKEQATREDTLRRDTGGRDEKWKVKLQERDAIWRSEEEKLRKEMIQIEDDVKRKWLAEKQQWIDKENEWRHALEVERKRFADEHTSLNERANMTRDQLVNEWRLRCDEAKRLASEAQTALETLRGEVRTKEMEWLTLNKDHQAAVTRVEQLNDIIKTKSNENEEKAAEVYHLKSRLKEEKGRVEELVALVKRKREELQQVTHSLNISPSSLMCLPA
jgi:chromosome segregation ATPase